MYSYSLNRTNNFPNLLKKDLMGMSEVQLKNIAKKYYDFYSDLVNDKSDDVEYKNYKNLKKYDKELARISSIRSKIWEVMKKRKIECEY